ncbi:MAG: UDP-glucose/GDP-mannose dehydrogenase family protein [Hyphomicrobiaceae bacterium]|nr:UDP-glucose/GDP-mannose dehydrogenase family protein [Hyphomicrobiaceae bacterium]MCC0024710.1 UDP-glucose/GDP-mannose dehydrogenase family protein [Hyphomicrobiaceae bacterium]
MRLAMIGTGYVGLVSGACFADFGHHVTCVDSDTQKIDALRDGLIPIYEPGLEELVKNNVTGGRLDFATAPDDAVSDADVVFLAVGTPSRRGDGHADLQYVFAAARQLVPLLRDDAVIVTKSTVPVGTGDEIERIVAELRPGSAIKVASNPEFMREGAAIDEFRRPNRIIVGVDSEHAREVMSEVYRPLYLNQAPLVFVSRRTAELTKYAANAFLAMKISFINEIADLCEKTGANVQDVARGIGLDQRIGSKFLHSGPGFGGSCFPKDLLALSKTAHDFSTELRLVEATIYVNDRRKRDMAKKVIAACGGSVRGKTICMLGLTFKPNTDDMRDAPSLSIITALLDQGASIVAHDPVGNEQAQRAVADSRVRFVDDPYEAAKGADAAVIVTEWTSLRALDLDRLGTAMAERVLVDLRNIYRKEEVVRAGFAYHCVGRPTEETEVSENATRFESFKLHA